jgi:hypothetical protein
MHTSDRVAQTQVADVIAAALDHNLTSLASAPPAVQDALSRSRQMTAAVAERLTPEMMGRRRLVTLFMASPDACTAAVVPSSVVLQDAADPDGWQLPE